MGTVSTQPGSQPAVEDPEAAQGAVAPASGDTLRRGNFSRTLRLNMDLKFIKPANEG
jgi:hypothetical protein